MPETSHSKPCTLCHTPRDVLVRCQIDTTGTWQFVCPGRCWRGVSGGVIDGDGEPTHAHYRYGGMWKNKHEGVSAKKPKRVKIKEKEEKNHGEGKGGGEEGIEEGGRGVAREGKEWSGNGVRFTKNDVVRYEGRMWVCRKSHVSEEARPPETNISQWKEAMDSIADNEAE